MVFSVSWVIILDLPLDIYVSWASYLFVSLFIMLTTICIFKVVLRIQCSLLLFWEILETNIWYPYCLPLSSWHVKNRSICNSFFFEFVWSAQSTVRTGPGTTDWFQIGKGVRQGCILSPCSFNFYAEYIRINTGLNEAQAGSRLLGEISITSDMQMTSPLWQKVKKS